MAEQRMQHRAPGTRQRYALERTACKHEADLIARSLLGQPVQGVAQRSDLLGELRSAVRCEHAQQPSQRELGEFPCVRPLRLHTFRKLIDRE